VLEGMGKGGKKKEVRKGEDREKRMGWGREGSGGKGERKGMEWKKDRERVFPAICKLFRSHCCIVCCRV